MSDSQVSISASKYTDSPVFYTDFRGKILVIMAKILEFKPQNEHNLSVIGQFLLKNTEITIKILKLLKFVLILWDGAWRPCKLVHDISRIIIAMQSLLA